MFEKIIFFERELASRGPSRESGGGVGVGVGGDQFQKQPLVRHHVNQFK